MASRLTLLLPARDRFGTAALPHELGRVLARADRDMLAAGGKAQIQRHLQAIPAHCPVAAITRHVDAPGAEQQAWLRADPAWVRVDINGGRMLACGEMGLTLVEAQALIEPLRTLFGDEGFPISAPTPSRWYLMLPRESKVPPFAPPDEVLGDDLVEHLPAGNDGRRWRRLLNEAQVMLHNHPINERRIAQGKPPVNSLWFWGGGVLPDFVQCSARVCSEDVVVHGLLKIAQIAPQPLPARFDSGLRDGACVVDLRRLRDAAMLARDWVLPANSALRAGDELRLDCGDGAQYLLRRSQRWRFWRRSWTVWA